MLFGRSLAVAVLAASSSCSIVEVSHDIKCTIGGEPCVVRVWIDGQTPGVGIYGVLFDTLVPLDVFVSPVKSVASVFDSRVRTKGPWVLAPVKHLLAMVLPGVTSMSEDERLGRIQLELRAGATLGDVRSALGWHRSALIPIPLVLWPIPLPLWLRPPPEFTFWGEIRELEWVEPPTPADHRSGKR